VIWSNACSSSSWKLSFIYSLFSIGACTFSTMISHQRPFRVIYAILLLTNSALLNAEMILICKKNPVPNWLEKCIIICCLISLPFPPNLLYSH
jgi:hypothetical protein